MPVFVLKCQGKVLRTHHRRDSFSLAHYIPAPAPGDAGLGGCCAHLLILKQRSRLRPLRARGPLSSGGYYISKR